MAHQRWRLLELMILFVAMPTALTFLVPLRLMAAVLFPTLFLSLILCLIVLLRDPTFDRKQLWNFQGVKRGIAGVLIRLAIFGPIVALAVWLFFPENFLSFPLNRTKVWMIVMTLYPLLSVYPQEAIYRAFFFHRYERLLGGNHEQPSTSRSFAPAIASAAAFGYMHILFRNEIAVLLTFVGGVYFALGYQRHRSTALAWIDHALWGCFAFTIGLGQFFFLGGIARASAGG